MYIKVKVSPKSKKESVVQTSKDHFKICVKEEAKQNLANGRVVELVAEAFGVPKGKVRIISGHHSPGKILSVDNE